MTVYVLGAGASAHAGYPVASALGIRLACWIQKTTQSNHKYRLRIEQLKQTYGTLDDFEGLMIDLMTCSPGSKATNLPPGMRPYLMGDIREAIRDYFDAIRQQPAPLYDLLARKHIRQGCNCQDRQGIL